jgi:mannose-6-phosphate isomerase-like protein (cupin superfamily)
MIQMFEYISTEDFMIFPRKPVNIVAKGWGREVWIVNNDAYCGKILEISKGKRCSLHFHRLKAESFFIRRGRIRILLKQSLRDPGLEEHEMQAGDCIDIPREYVHQIEALEDTELYEFSTQHFDTDSHRLVPGD